MVTFFTSGGRGAAGLSGLVRQLLGNSIIDTMETQIRNAFLTAPMAFYVGGGTGWGDIGATDLYDPELAMDVQLNFSYHEVVDPNAPGGVSAVAYASPGVIYSAQSNSTFLDKIKYASEGVRRIFRYEMGSYKGLRYLSHPRNTLYNCGVMTAQATVETAITAGDGAPDPTSTKVMGSYEVGQRAGSQTHGLTLTTFLEGAIADFEVGDIISIHTTRSAGTTAPYTVVNAPLPTDGKKVERQIVAVSGNTLRLDKPIMRDYSTDLGSGVYAFVTKGLHIHATIVVAAPGAVVGGFAQPPQLHVPPAIDDLEAMFRLSWDGYYDYGLFRTEMAAVIYSAGYVSQAAYKNLGN